MFFLLCSWLEDIDDVWNKEEGGLVVLEALKNLELASHLHAGVLRLAEVVNELDRDDLAGLLALSLDDISEGSFS